MGRDLRRVQQYHEGEQAAQRGGADCCRTAQVDGHGGRHQGGSEHTGERGAPRHAGRHRLPLQREVVPGESHQPERERAECIDPDTERDHASPRGAKRVSMRPPADPSKIRRRRAAWYH